MVYCTKQQELYQESQRSNVATGNAGWPSQTQTQRCGALSLRPSPTPLPRASPLPPYQWPKLRPTPLAKSRHDLVEGCLGLPRHTRDATFLLSSPCFPIEREQKKKGSFYKRGLFTETISRISISSKFSRISREWTLLQDPFFQRPLFRRLERPREADLHSRSMGECRPLMKLPFPTVQLNESRRWTARDLWDEDSCF